MLFLFQRVSLWLIPICLLGMLTTAGAQEDEKEKAKTPLGEFFRQLDRGIRNEADELEQIQKSRDQLDMRVPQNAELHRRFQQLQRSIQNEEWHQAIELIHILQQHPEDMFLMDVERNLTSLRDGIDASLLSLPEAGRRGYLSRFEAVAREEYELAILQNDVDALRRVARQFMLTNAGQAAAVRLMWAAVDQGEFQIAADWGKRLSRFTSSATAKHKYRARAIQFLIDAGAHSQASAWIEEWQYTGLTEEQLATLQTSDEVLETPSNAVTPYSDSEDQNWRTGDFLQSWSVDQISRYSVRAQVQELISGLTNRPNSRVLLPNAIPLIVNQELVLKTLSGVTIRDLKTGDLLWHETIDGDLEARLTPNPFDQSLGGLREPTRDQLSPYNVNMEDEHSLASLVFRDQVRTRITSDGTRLFLIKENHVPSTDEYGFRWQWRNDTGEKKHLATNALTAWDCSSRRPIWTLGGKLIEEGFSRRLAGTYFLGPPVAHGDRLYVVGEQDEAVKLFVLEAATGDVIFSQTLSFPGRPIDDDIVRRNWDCTPIIADSLAICPTTCGWLTAVNLETQRLAWSTRYSKRSLATTRRRGNSPVHSTQPLNTRWQYSSLSLVGSSILFNPPELPDEQNQSQSALICFDRKTGTEQWRLPKNGTLFLQGIDGNLAILVDKLYVKACDLNHKGMVLWQKKIPFPSGRGVIVDHQLLLPVSGGKLLKFNLADGTLSQEYHVPGMETLIGNLTLHNGTLYALSPLSLTAFKPTNHSEQLFPVAIHELLKRVEVDMMKLDGGDHAYQMIQKFRQQNAGQILPPGDRQQLDSAEWNVLTHLASQSTLNSKQAERIAELATTDEQVVTAKLIRADVLRKSGDLSSCVDVLLELLQSAEPSFMVEDGTRRVRLDLWIGSRLKIIFAELPVDERSVLNNRLVTTVSEHDQDTKLLQSYARALTFHPLQSEIELDLGQRALHDGQFTAALVRFQRATQSESSSVRQSAWLSIGRAYLKQKMFADAKQAFDAFLADCEIHPPTEMNLISEARSARNECAEQLVKLDQGRAVPEKWDISRRGSFESESRRTFPILGTASQRLQALHSTVDFENDLLHLHDSKSGQLEWILPIRMTSGYSRQVARGLRAVGPMLFVYQSGHILALNVHEKQMAWTRSSEMPSKREVLAHVTRLVRGNHSLTLDDRFLTENSLSRRLTGNFHAVSEDAVVLKTDVLEVLDPLTGEVLWTDDTVPERTAVHIVGEKMVMIESAKTTVRNIHDGTVISFPLLENSGKNLIRLSSDRMVTALPGKDDNDGALAFVCRSLETGEQIWKHQCEAKTMFSAISFGEVTWITPKHQIRNLNLNTGTITNLGKLPEVDQLRYKRITIIHDSEMVYVNIPEIESKRSHISMRSIPVSGILQAYNRSGKLEWSQQVADFDAYVHSFEVDKPDKKTEDQNKDNAEEEENIALSMNLLTDDFRYSPLLILVLDQPNHSDEHFFRQLALVCLDKRTGKIKADWKQVSTSGSFRQLQMDLRDQSTSLFLYNERIKISPVIDEGKQ